MRMATDKVFLQEEWFFFCWFFFSLSDKEQHQSGKKEWEASQAVTAGHLSGAAEDYTILSLTKHILKSSKQK